MDTSWLSFRSTVRERLLDLLWRQWSAIGVPGHGPAEECYVVDPEALLLLTMSVGRYDPRLFDEAVDWLSVNSPFINVQRLRNLVSTYAFEGTRPLSALAAWLKKKSTDAKWKVLAAPLTTETTLPARDSFFLLADGTPMPDPRTPSTEFMAVGYRRGQLTPLGKAGPFPLQGMPSLLLRLRALLGVNARCELLCTLGASEEVHPSGVARPAGYSTRTTQTTLAGMAASGMVKDRPERREKRYSRAGETLLPLLRPEGKLTPWKNFAPLFRACEILWLSIDDPMRRQIDDPVLAASEFRRIAKAIRPLVGETGLGARLSEGAGYRGESYTSVFVREISGLLAEISPLP